MVSISDSDSGDLGSIPSEAFAFCIFWPFFFVLFFFYLLFLRVLLVYFR